MPTHSAQTQAPVLHLRNALLSAVIGFLFALPGLFSLPPLDRDESRFAQASAQMLETGDFVRIRFQDEARNKKPAGIHWLQAASVTLFSSVQAREIWAYRLPSALAAALAAAFTYLAGARLLGTRPALLGACLLGASVLLSTEGMIAKTDAALCACTAAALAAAAWLRTRPLAHFQQKCSCGFVSENAQIQTYRASNPAKSGSDFADDALAHFQQKCSCGFVSENAQIQTYRASNPAKSGSDFADDALASNGRLSAIAFWIALAAGVLIKGPLTPGIALLGLASIGLWEKKWAWMAPLLSPWGPLLALAMIAPWGIAIALATEGQFFAQALGGDLAGKLALQGAESHAAPPGLHLLLTPLLSFPITLGLPFAAMLVYQAARAPRGDAAYRGIAFLAAWLVPSWLAFELAPTKLPHYPLPLYPCLALLAAAGLAQGFDIRPKLRGTAAALFAVCALALAGVCAGASALAFADPAGSTRRAWQTFLLLAPLAVLVSAAIAWWGGPGRATAMAIALSGVLLFTARERIAPEARTVLVTQQAVLALQREHLLDTPHQPLLAVGFSEPSLIFSTHTSAQLSKGIPGGMMAVEGQAALVEERERQDFAAALAKRGLIFTPRGAPITGTNYSKGRRVSLQPGEITLSRGADLSQTR